MNTALEIHRKPGTLTNGAPDLIQAFLAGRSELTLRAYRGDLEDFRSFLGAADLDDAAARLLGGTHGEANGLALAYRNHLVEQGLAPATVNRRLAAVRSLVKLARTLGAVPWSLEVPNVEAQAYRDTRGPGVEGFRRLLTAAQGSGRKARRDRAILRLLFDLGLRRSEVCRLDIEDLDLETSTVAILGKRRTQKELRTLPRPTKEALEGWLAVRGTEPGPVFVNCSRAHGDERLTPTGLTKLVKELGERVGVKVTPHGLRHAAITCLVIHDPQEFGRRLAEAVALHHPGWRFVSGDVEYFDPLQVSVHEVEPLTWKHFRYAYQREYRLAWVPSSSRRDLTALDVSVGSLTDIAEIVQPFES